MLRISRLADYATTVMYTLAQSPGKRFSAAQLSGETQLSAPTVSKVLKLLNDARLVNSERGATGGYQLARMPEAINVADIIAAIDGMPAMTECCKGENICKHDRVCILRHQWQMINTVISDFLKGLNLRDMSRPLILNKQPLKGGASCGGDCQCAMPRTSSDKVSHA